MSQEKSLTAEISSEVMASENNFLTTPLHKAVAQGNLDEIRHLLKTGADINCPDFLGVTPLQSSLLFSMRTYHYFNGEPSLKDGAKYREITEFLLEAGADVNSPDHMGRTPIFYALAKYCPVLMVSTEDWNNPYIKEEHLGQWKKDFLAKAAQSLGFNPYDRERVDELKEENLTEGNRSIASISYQYGTLKRFNDPRVKDIIESFNEDFTVAYSLLELGADITIRDYDDKTIFSYILHNRSCETVAKIGTKIFTKMENILKKEDAENIRMEIFDSVSADLYHHCKMEMEELKDEKVFGRISLIDLLCQPSFIIKGYSKVEHFEKILSSGEFKKYKNYAKFLELNIRKGIERGLLYDPCIGVAQHFYISDRLLPYVVCDKILNFLPSCDLKKLATIDV